MLAVETSDALVYGGWTVIVIVFTFIFVSILWPTRPFDCPSCGSTDVEYVVEPVFGTIALPPRERKWWQIVDLPEKRPPEMTYGLCSSCGGRVARADFGRTYVPDGDEWDSHV